MLRLHQNLLGAAGCFPVWSNSGCKHAVVETETQKETTGLDTVEKDIFFPLQGGLNHSLSGNTGL